MRLRIEQELALLCEVYSNVEHVEDGGEDWFKVPSYAIPAGWRIGEQTAEKVPVAFLIKADYPGAAPYGFLTPSGLNFDGKAPQNVGGPPKPLPFAGDWLHFSWTVQNWEASTEVHRGSSLVSWCRSFAVRLKEGV